MRIVIIIAASQSGWGLHENIDVYRSERRVGRRDGNVDAAEMNCLKKFHFRCSAASECKHSFAGEQSRLGNRGIYTRRADCERAGNANLKTIDYQRVGSREK